MATSNGAGKARGISECSATSNDSEGWLEVDESSQTVSCIFTGKTFSSAHEYFIDLKQNFDFDIWQIVLSEFQLDFFGYVKLINYLRSNYKGKNQPSQKELSDSRSEWEKEVYLKPVVDDDPLLQFMIGDDDFESDEDEENTIEEIAMKKFMEGSPEQLLEQERKINKDLHENLDRALKQIDEMKKFMHNVILTGNVDFLRPVSACRQNTDDLEFEDEQFEDSGYYGTYSHHEIHAEMLQDSVRTLGYRNAVLLNENTFKDKIVLDVGCGTGILSMFCAQAGAKHVYGVDMSEMAYQAIDIARENGFADKITIIKSTVEELQLPVDKVDIIISEWMGYFLLYESMFDSVIFARNKWLHDEGMMLPTACSINMLGAHDEQLYNKRVNFWSNVYGFKMPSLRKQVVTEGYVLNVKASAAVTETAEIFRMDTKKSTEADLNFKSDFSLKVLKSGNLSFLVGYFDTFFQLNNHVQFSTSPFDQLTHWKQTIFLLQNPLQVTEGDVLSCSIYCRKNPKDPRSLIVDLKVADHEQSFKIE